MSEVARMDFMAPETLQCPFPFYAAARREAPVYRLPNSPVQGRDVYLVTRYDTIQRVLRDWKTFSNRFGELMSQGKANQDPELDTIRAEGFPLIDTMLTQDPPLQRKYRSFVTRSFSMAKVEEMGDYMHRICDGLIDGFIGRGACDFFEDFAVPLPVYVIADRLGAPRADIAKIKRWSDDTIAGLGRTKGREAVLRAARSQVEMQHYFVGLIEARREDPRDDVISELAHARFDGERPLNLLEILSILGQLLVAGNETTTHSLAGGMVYILGQPDMQDRLAAEPSLIPGAVDEILRLEASTKHMWRIVTADTELEGVSLPAGGVLLLSYDSANRDETVFPDANQFIHDRANAREHLSFGAGLHTCVGNLLAKKEMAIAYERLFSRLKTIRLPPDHPPLHYTPSILHRGLDGLSLSFDRR